MATPKFRPYRGLEAKIKSFPQQPGYVYFATDTGRIYLDYEGQRLAMGGNGASLYYANDTDVKQDLLENYLLDYNTLADEEAKLKPDDLIINADGAFYRVLDINDEEEYAICARIAVSGTGGGGGSGDGPSGPSGPTNHITLTQVSETPPTAFIYGQSYLVTLKAFAEFDNFSIITVQIFGENDQTYTSTLQADNNVEFSIDIGKHLFLGLNRIEIVASADNSGTSTPRKYTSRYCYEMALRKDASFNPLNFNTGVLTFPCVPVGTFEKTLEVYVNGTLEATQNLTAAQSDYSISVNIPKQEHGVYKISAKLIANLSGVPVVTDPIEYQVAWVDSNVNTPLIWTPNGYPSKIVQYEDLRIEYVVWSPELKEIETRFYKRGVELPNSPQYLDYSNSSYQYWNITDYEVGNNSYAIMVGSASLPLNIFVEEDTERDLDILQGGLVLNLDSAGRSNLENISSKTRWVSTDPSNSGIAVKFNNFNWYNNGWIEDENKKTCLRISNGASIEIPVGTLNVLNSANVNQALAFEFRFKVRNVQEYSTLITTESEEDENGKLIVHKTASTERGVIGSLYKTLGFCIGTQEAFLASSNNTIVNARYREDEVINLTFVIDNNSASLPLMYIYLQGILSGIAKYGAADQFNSGANSIVFNSDYCDIDLYNVRIYRGVKLESADVVHNYIADRKDVKAYDANQITTFKSGIPTIDFQKMISYNTNHPDETLIPYMVIESLDSDNRLPFVKGGKKPVNIEFKNPALDYAFEKGYITGEEYLRGAPSFTYSSKKKSLDVQGTSSQGYPRRNYKWKAKQEDAKWRYTGGPIKGYPIYEYNKEQDTYVGHEYNGVSYKKFFLDSDIGETTFCLKADYMESSGTHNTGYASYVSTLYSKHPLNDYFPKAVLPSSIRTTIYGFPIIVFQKTGANTYEFVGRYNFNLDKGATDTCGFTYEADSFVKGEDGKFLPIEEVAECWEIKNNQGERTSFTKVDFEETTDAYNEIELTSETFIPDTYYTKVVNPTAATESYVLASTYDANQIYYAKQSGVLSILEDFEYRYSAFEDEIDHAIDGTDEFAGISQSIRNQTILHRMRNFKDMATWLESTDVQNGEKLGALLGKYTEVTLDEESFADGTQYYIWNTSGRKWVAVTADDTFDVTAKYATVEPQPVVYGDMPPFEYDTREYRLQKFTYEFKDHFDLEYCVVYFIMTELLHLYDSRGKNCMMATWGPQKEGGNYIWYPIFYDIDTQLGINNSGVPSWEYDVNPTEDFFFSTSNGVLWNNMWAVFRSDILNRYVELRKSELTIDNMDGYYNSHAILGRGDIDSWKDIELESIALKDKLVSVAKLGKRPVMIYNVDQYYKYIGPATAAGFINTSGAVEQTEGFFYCLQGSRELMRYLYLRNRLNFVDSKWHGGSYSAEGILGGGIKARYNANVLGLTSDGFIHDASLPNGSEKNGYIVANWTADGPINEYDCTADFEDMRSYLKQYMSIQFDGMSTNPLFCDGINEIDIKSGLDSKIQTTEGFQEQLFYIGGGEYIADLGDLSTKYLNEFHMNTLKRLKRLKLGSDLPNYHNALLSGGDKLTFGAGALVDGEINKNAKTLLEEVILTNLTALSGQLDFSGSEKLKTFRALNTQISGVSLARGVQIETLHLPNTTTNIILTEPVALQGILSSPTDGEGKFNKGLFIEGITNATDLTKNIKMLTYEIVGGNMGYDSYKLLKTLTDIKLNMQGKADSELIGYSKELAISVKSVNWSPFSVVEYGEAYDSSKPNIYYVDNDRYGLEVYTDHTDKRWEYYTRNSKIYIYNADYLNANSEVITDLGLLDTYIDSYIAAKEYFDSPNGSLERNYFKNTSVDSLVPTIPEITGILYVNNTDPVDEAEIINKYLAYFPKLQIFCKNIKKAYGANFITLIDGVETLIYSERKSSDTAADKLNITYPPVKDYTPARLNYDFLGWSVNSNANPEDSNVYCHPEQLPGADTPESIAAFEARWGELKYTSTDSIIKFYAIFDSTKFKAIFKNHYQDGRPDEIITTEYVTAGDYLYEPDVLPTTDESGLADDIRYKLLGWVSDPQYCFPANLTDGKKYLVNLSSIISENVDRTFYACYIQENVLDTATDSRYFTFTARDYKDDYDNSYNISGYICAPKTDAIITGKITIPDTYEGLPVIGLQKVENSDITHIYFKNPETIRILIDIANNAKLRVFKFPVGLRYIQGTASGKGFRGNSKLKFDSEGFAKSRLAVIDSMNCFTDTFDFTEGQIPLLRLPGTLQYMNNYIFMNLSGTISNRPPAGQFYIEEVSFGGPDDPSEFDISKVLTGSLLFKQGPLNEAPLGENTTKFTSIKTFTYYKHPSSLNPTQDAFESFVNSDKVLGGPSTQNPNNTLNIQVVDVEV